MALLERFYDPNSGAAGAQGNFPWDFDEVYQSLVPGIHNNRLTIFGIHATFRVHLLFTVALVFLTIGCDIRAIVKLFEDQFGKEGLNMLKNMDRTL